MKTHRLSSILAVISILGAMFSSVTAVAAPASEGQLLEVLASNAPAPAKRAACCELRTVGTEKSIPRLAALLVDPAVSHCARIALEAMPYPAAGAALREGAAQATGAAKAGILDSLGNRHDREAISLATAALEDKDLQVLSAAAGAIAKIGTPEAAQNLLAAHAKAQGVAQSAIANALLFAADRLLAQGDRKVPTIIYCTLAQAGRPPTVRAAALRGYLRVADSSMGKLLLEWFAGNDPLFRAAAAAQLGLLSPADLKTVATGLPWMPPASQAAVLMAIRLKGDKSLLPLVTEAAATGSPIVCVAAIGTLGVLGTSATAPMLVAAMASGDPTAQVARESLEALRDPDVDGRIVTAMRQQKDAARRAALIAILQSRRSVSSVPALLEEARQGPAREQAVTALALLAGPQNVPAMIDLALNTPKGADREQVERAVVLVCRRIPDEKKRSAPVLEAFERANPANRIALFPMLGRLGGDDARRMVEAALTGADAERCDAAMTALCNWPDASVADRLWQLAQQERDPSRRERLLRAAVRLITQPGGVADSQKIARLTEAMRLARSTEDRAWILERAAAVRHVESLRLVRPYLDDPALTQTACKTVVELAHHRELREPNQKEFTPALEKVLAIVRDQTLVERARRYLGK